LRPSVRHAAACACLALASLSPAPVLAETDVLRSQQWGLDRIRAQDAWSRSDGAGAVVAVIDTGVDAEHEDLRGLVVPGRDFVDGSSDRDRNGHGTHVAGIIGARSGNGLGISGAAPGARVMAVRALDADGLASEARVADAVDYSVRRCAELGVRCVVNLSLSEAGLPGDAWRRLVGSIRDALATGAVVVAAAGAGEQPDIAGLVTVAAVDRSNRPVDRSVRGPTVAAPGAQIVSTDWSPSRPEIHSSYASGSGASMAAPFVSAVAAMLLASGVPGSEVPGRLSATAEDLGSRARYGHGLVNAARAMAGQESSPMGARAAAAVAGGLIVLGALLAGLRRRGVWGGGAPPS
jgi:subtilisin family serine protease